MLKQIGKKISSHAPRARRALRALRTACSIARPSSKKPLRRARHTNFKKIKTWTLSGTEAQIAEKSLETKFLRTRRAPGARCARCSPPAALLDPQARSPYVELGTPISKIPKTCKTSGTDARIAEKSLARKIFPSGLFFFGRRL